jgi:hypothetical protein
VKRTLRLKRKEKPKRIGKGDSKGERGLRIAEPASPSPPNPARSSPAVVSDKIAAPRPETDPNAILPAKLTAGGPPIASYPATVPTSPGQLLLARDGRPDSEVMADSALSPVVLNALTAMNVTRPSMAKGDLATVGITAFVKVMGAKVAAVAAGDMSGIEATMTAQVVSMDALFSELAMKAQSNISAGYLDAGETYMRLAFKAQAQCRATAETLGELKNPRPVFAKQFNLANGNQQINQTDGPQQVNNLPAAPAPRAPENPLSPNKLLEQEA